MVSDPGTSPHTHLLACFVAGFQYMNTLASYDYVTISGLNPFTCVWPTIPFPLAPQAQLPSPAQSSVLAWWLAVDQIGLSNSLISVLLGALILRSLKIQLLNYPGLKSSIQDSPFPSAVRLTAADTESVIGFLENQAKVDPRTKAINPRREVSAGASHVLYSNGSTVRDGSRAS